MTIVLIAVEIFFFFFFPFPLSINFSHFICVGVREGPPLQSHRIGEVGKPVWRLLV